MATNTSVQGSVTLRKLRSGATATVSLSSTKQLFQLYSIGANNNVICAPNWSTAANAPVVSVNIVSSQGNLTVWSVVWEINGVLATSIDSGITLQGNSLKINANLVEALNYTSGTLTATIMFKDDSGNLQTVIKSETIRVQQAVESGYNLMINANRTWVDSSNNARLDVVAYLGTQEATSNLTYKWFKSTASDAASISTDTYLNVTPDMIDGSQLFICRGYSDDGEVDAESVNIVDNSDTFVLQATATQYKGGSVSGDGQENVTSVNVGSDNEKTVVTYKVMTRSGGSYSGVPKSWSVSKMHADTMKLIKQVSGQDYTQDTETVDYNYNTQTANNVATVSINVLDADYVSVGNGTVAKHDTEVIVTATATLQ